jgi:hypothetical protein
MLTEKTMGVVLIYINHNIFIFISQVKANHILFINISISFMSIQL